MIAVFSALNPEIRDWKKRMQIDRSEVYQDSQVWEGCWGPQAGLLVLTGAGKNRAQAAAGWVLQKYPVRAVISTGFAGALNNRSRAGDILVYSRLCCRDTDEKQFSNMDINCDSKLTSHALRCLNGQPIRSIQGDGITISGVCATVESKVELGREFEADAVDMESYWIGRIALEKGVPFLAARSIFDSVQDDLSFLNRVNPDGHILPWKICQQILAHPGQSRSFPHFYQNYRKAAKNLAVFMSAMMEKF